MKVQGHVRGRGASQSRQTTARRAGATTSGLRLWADGLADYRQDSDGKEALRILRNPQGPEPTFYRPFGGSVFLVDPARPSSV
jgi:hypothetical protein